MGKRGPKKQWDFTLDEYIIDGAKLMSFKSSLSAFNRDKEIKLQYDYAFKSNSGKVTATIKRIA